MLSESFLFVNKPCSQSVTLDGIEFLIQVIVFHLVGSLFAEHVDGSLVLVSVGILQFVEFVSDISIVEQPGEGHQTVVSEFQEENRINGPEVSVLVVSPVGVLSEISPESQKDVSSEQTEEPLSGVQEGNVVDGGLLLSNNFFPSELLSESSDVQGMSLRMVGMSISLLNRSINLLGGGITVVGLRFRQFLIESVQKSDLEGSISAGEIVLGDGNQSLRQSSDPSGLHHICSLIIVFVWGFPS
mmetsp:Transcript_55751/g.63643  ORF Transcript_55751/g.63643 Transcript_55751/m.63643 type:complete len:243 (+) Transcript_55751:731-1459(+)